MEVLEYATYTTHTQSKLNTVVFSIAKRISKQIIKEIVTKDENVLKSSLYVKQNFYYFPINYFFDGQYIKIIFFEKSLFPEIICINPGDIDELLEDICKIIESIFERKLKKIRIRSINYKLLPSDAPYKQSILLMSYKIIC